MSGKVTPELAEHLRFYAELGVTGVSRDPEWRTRAQNKVPEVPEVPGVPEVPEVPGVPEVPEVPGVHGMLQGGEAGSDPVRGGGDPVALLAALKVEIGPDCTRCKLHTLGRRQVVFGVGNPKAQLMFVGEAPGEDEDKQGEPFVGRAGQLLTKIIEAIGLTREQVYIANLIKCRPPNNRNPEPDEVEQCEPFLFRQIDAIQPRVIVALGKFAAQSLLRTTEPITKMRGKVFSYRGGSLIPTFHPAYLLRNPPAKREVWEDMKKVRSILQGEQ